MRKPVAAACSLLLVAAACSSSSSTPAADAPAPQESPSPAVAEVAAESGLDGIYSEAQASRGEHVFSGVCGECHYTNEFRDDQFQFSWRRRTVADLFGHISDTMPENAPGSLTPRQYADVVAYILSLNGVAPGPTELPHDSAALRAFSLATLSKG